MKYSLFLSLLVSISLSSCEISDDGLDISYEAVSIDTVSMPQELNFGQQYNIPVFYKRPSDCHVFEGFDVDANLNERFITLVMARLSRGTCNEEFVQEQQDLTFIVASNGTYIFKFFTTEDLNQDGLGPDYIEYEVPVIE